MKRGGRVQQGRSRRQSILHRSPARRSIMADKTKVVEQYYTPPPDLGGWESFRIFLWNSETGQFLGRTGASWGELPFPYFRRESISGFVRLIFTGFPLFGFIVFVESVRYDL